MIILNILPIIFSSLLIAAHCFRAGYPLVSALCLFLPLLLISGNRWIPRLITVFLLLSAAEWLRTMLIFIGDYQGAGISWTRLAVILSGVSLFTALSPLIFKSAAMKKRYQALN